MILGSRYAVTYPPEIPWFHTHKLDRFVCVLISIYSPAFFSAFCVEQEEVVVTPHAVVEKNNREVLRLFEPGVCR